MSVGIITYRNGATGEYYVYQVPQNLFRYFVQSNASMRKSKNLSNIRVSNRVMKTTWAFTFMDRTPT